VARLASEILAHVTNPEVVVTDVAGVKGSIVGRHRPAIPRWSPHGRFGVARTCRCARRPLSRFHVVLTPTDQTSPSTYSTLHGILREIGANVVAVSAEDHDRLVAIASHVPHLLPAP